MSQRRLSRLFPYRFYESFVKFITVCDKLRSMGYEVEHDKDLDQSIERIVMAYMQGMNEPCVFL